MRSTADNTDYTKLVPELKDWNEGKGIDIEDWIYYESSLEHAVGFGSLFWPAFLEYDGCIIMASGFDPKRYDGFLKQTKGDKRAVEVVMNHRHIADLFRWETAPMHDLLIHVG